MFVTIKSYISLLLLVLAISTVFAQKKERVKWNAETLLTWSDFKGTPNSGENYVASTNSGIVFQFKFENNNRKTKATYTIGSYFYPKLSWFRKGLVSERILKHEQTHFDISELFSRKLREKLSHVSADEKDVKKIIEEIYYTNERERQEYQALFDLETDHSQREKEEIVWEQKIAQELTAYDNWQ